MYIKIVHTHPVELYRVTNSAPFSSGFCALASDVKHLRETGLGIILFDQVKKGKEQWNIKLIISNKV